MKTFNPDAKIKDLTDYEVDAAFVEIAMAALYEVDGAASELHIRAQALIDEAATAEAAATARAARAAAAAEYQPGYAPVPHLAAQSISATINQPAVETPTGSAGELSMEARALAEVYAIHAAAERGAYNA